MKTTSNLSKSDSPIAYEKWELPFIGEQKAKVTAKELETIQEQAFKEGFTQGHEAKNSQLEQEIMTFKSLIEVLSEPLKNMDNEIVEQLSELSMIVAKQVIRRELHTEQGEIVGIVREAMAALPASTRKTTLNINPNDAELIRNAFSISAEQEANDADELRWVLVEDPMITQGGCTIVSKNSRIDASVEARLNRVISTLLGGERESDE
ncbi:MAG: FliH/SctL family protein [Woeseiaceae bacterium]